MSARRIFVFGAVAITAIVLGFIALSPFEVGELVIRWGYFFIIASTLLWVISLLRFMMHDGLRLKIRAFDALVIVALAVLVMAYRAPGFNIMFDEPVLATVSQVMHSERKAGYAISAHYEGEGVVVDQIALEKRPMLYPFFVSIVHDVTGYRVANGFWVNATLTFGCLLLIFYAGRALAGKARGELNRPTFETKRGEKGGLLAAALLAGLPVLSENSSGGGLAIVNLFMILVTLLFAMRWLENGTETSLAALVFSVVLLAQARYESALFVVAVAAVILLGYWVYRKVCLPWILVPVPFLLLPLPWVIRGGQAIGNPQFVRDGVSPEHLFAIGLLRDNVRHALGFLFDWGHVVPNSPVLSIIGGLSLGGLIAIMVRNTPAWLRRPSTSPRVVLVAFGAVIIVNAGILLFYYWGHWDSVVASRLTLPLMALFALAPSALFPLVRPQRVLIGVTAVLTVVGLFAYTLAANARGTLLAGYRERAEIRAMVDLLEDPDGVEIMPGVGAFVITTSPQATIASGFPGISFKSLASDPKAFEQIVNDQTKIVVFQVSRHFRDGDTNLILSTHQLPELPEGTSIRFVASFPLVDECSLIVSTVGYDDARMREDIDS